MNSMSYFQRSVRYWLVACFGEDVAAARKERGHRFLEEAIELVQSTGVTTEEAHQLVDYVYGRPIGETKQEVGGVMITLAGLCSCEGVDLEGAANDELKRVWDKIEVIRAKQAVKPAFGEMSQ